MRRLISLTLALVVALTLIAAPAFAAETITVFNWYDYIDEDVIKLFEEETGISVKYANFTDNEEMYIKVKNSPSAYDVIVPSDYIIERMIREDLLEKLDLSVMPHIEGIIEWMRTPAYDPTGEYSAAYMWGTLGILYNTDMVEEEIESWESLFDITYKRNVIMMKSIRDTIGMTLKMLGYSMNTREIEQLEVAKVRLLQQKADGIVKGYLLDETKDKMIAGEAALALMYSGDALYSMMENEALEYVVPIEGSNVWVDGMCIPKGSQNKEAAQQFIDFMCRPDIARMNMDYIYYSTPIQQVVDEMDEEERDNLTLNPSQEIIDRCEFFHDLGDFIVQYEQIWMEILS